MAYFFILLGAVLRVIPHPFNFAPVAAMALFGGVYLSKKNALLVPVAAMVISDFFIGFDSIESRLSVYACFAAIGIIGMWVKNHKSVVMVLGGSLVGSILFYLVTNFVFFHGTSLYPHTFDGLMQSYVNAIPFFRNTILGDLFYTITFFGSYELVMTYWNIKKRNWKLEIGN